VRTRDKVGKGLSRTGEGERLLLWEIITYVSSLRGLLRRSLCGGHQG
jgi:hypothetical protein